MEGLTDFEKAVLHTLLMGDNPVLYVLRTQADLGRVQKRERTEVGFCWTFQVDESAPSADPPNFEIDDVIGENDSLRDGMGFLLFVREGRLKMLEGFTYDEPLPHDLSTLSLRYTGKPCRGLNLVLRPPDV
jgi:hypothetical protein